MSSRIGAAAHSPVDDPRHEGEAAPLDEGAASPGVLDRVATPVSNAEVTLASGRRYSLDSGADSDRLTIRARNGEVVLRIEVSDRGPVLSFSSADIDIAAAQRIRLAAKRVEVEAAEEVSLTAGADIVQRATGDHRVSAGGSAQVQGGSVEMQANNGGVGVRAMRAIRLDGEHIGLNDDPLPAPFAWSDIAAGPEEEGKEP